VTVEVLDPQLAPPGAYFKGGSWAQCQAILSRAPEVLYSGRYGSSKSRTLTESGDIYCRLFDDARVIMARKRRVDLGLTTLRILLEQTISPSHAAVGWQKSAEGGSTLHYPNGSQIICVGLDEPFKLKSGEFDLILVDQCEEIEEDEWLAAAGRLRNKAGDYQSIKGACNPDSPSHWLFRKFNPTYSHKTYSNEDLKLPNGVVVPKGTLVSETILAGPLDNMENLSNAYLARLARFKGRYHARYVLGQWTSYEGIVFGDVWNPNVHCPPRPPEWERWGGYPPHNWPRFRSFDFGFNNPFVCQWWARDHDNVFWRYREMYMSHRTVPDHKAKIRAEEEKELAVLVAACEREAIAPPLRLPFSYSVADHDLGEREILAQSPHRIITYPARKEIESAVQTVYDLLSEGRIRLVQGALVEQDQSLLHDDKPTCTEEEMPQLHYPTTQHTSLVTRQREGPVKENDHGFDALAYLFDTLKNKNRPSVAR
jgi:phage terminase large subunit